MRTSSAPCSMPGRRNGTRKSRKARIGSMPSDANCWPNRWRPTSASCPTSGRCRPTSWSSPPATGPWAEGVALAQLTQGEDGQERREEPGTGENDDPQGYRRLIPALLWSAQPGLTRQNTALLNEVIPALLAQLRAGLVSIDYPPAQTSALLQRLVGLHQAAFEESTAETQNTRATVAAPA